MDYISINKKLWNNKTEVHFNSEFYDVKSFLGGKSSLMKAELDLLGDVRGKKILHLQCHFGMDTISLARMGAKVTGVDLSDKAIEKARLLNEQCGTDVEFVESDVLKLKDVLNDSFDIVFTSYGTVGWLDDLTKWADVVHHFLKPGGEFIMVDFHPVVWMFSYDFTKIEFNYMDTEAIVEELEGTYADKSSDLKDQSVGWNHGISGILNPLVHKGLRLADFQEYDYSPYNCFNNTIEISKGIFQIRGMEKKIPMMYSIKAVK